MRLQLEADVVERVAKAVREAGVNEVGGVLVGEHLGKDQFRVVDASIQETRGSPSCFVRQPEEHAEFLKAFHDRTNHDYRRFNYLGEWHSHPSFTAFPSLTDLRSMQDIVEDPTGAAEFAVLLVVKQHWWCRLEVHASAFRPGHEPIRAKVSAFDVIDTSASWFERLTDGLWGDS